MNGLFLFARSPGRLTVRLHRTRTAALLCRKSHGLGARFAPVNRRPLGLTFHDEAALVLAAVAPNPSPWIEPDHSRIHFVRSPRYIAVGYALTDLVTFAIGYYALRIREMGLYVFLLAVGLPASCGVVPLSESVAPRFGWSLGSAPHVWACAVTSVTLNLVIVGVIFGIIKASRQRRPTRPN
jgi:hypothetical protein